MEWKSISLQVGMFDNSVYGIRYTYKNDKHDITIW